MLSAPQIQVSCCVVNSTSASSKSVLNSSHWMLFMHNATISSVNLIVSVVADMFPYRYIHWSLAGLIRILNRASLSISSLPLTVLWTRHRHSSKLWKWHHNREVLYVLTMTRMTEYFQVRKCFNISKTSILSSLYCDELTRCDCVRTFKTGWHWQPARTRLKWYSMAMSALHRFRTIRPPPLMTAAQR